MRIINFTRNIKNIIVSNKKVLYFILSLINMPLIGEIYDFFYIRIIKEKIKKSEITINLEPNNICNLKCIMCPYKEMKRKKVSMSLQLFKKIVNQAKEIGCKEIHLTQYNEPFTDKFLFERLKYIRKSGLRSSFYSNATLLDEKMIDKLLENPPNLIRFSVDGVNKKTFESIRKGANYEEVVKNIRRLFKERNKRKLKLPVIEIFFTVLDKNKKETLRFLKEWKGHSDFASLYPADSRESGIFVGINYKKFKSYSCFNPKKVIILSNGKVALCCVDVDGKIILGDINKQTIKEILNSDKYKKIYESQLNRTCNIPMCKNCSKYYVDSAFTWWIY